MRILLVCPYDLSRPGGVQQHVIEWAAWLNQNGHNAAITAPSAADAHSFDTGAFRQVSVHGTRYELAWMDRKKREEFQQFMDDFVPDIVHYHAVWVPFMPLQVRLLARGKQVCTFHDTPADGWQQPLLRMEMQLASAFLSLFFDAFISVSEVQRRFLWRGRRSVISVIGNGLNAARFREGVSKDRERSSLLFLGRLEPRKGVLHALAVYEKLLPDFPSLRFLIAGDGPGRAEAERRATQIRGGAVSFLGRVTEQRKIELLRTCTLLVAPALYGESFGIVLLEAMAAGIPVCGFRNEGYAQLADRYDRTLFPKPGDERTLAAAATRLLRDASYSEKLSQLGQTVAAQFSWDSIGPEILNLYRSCLPSA